MQCSPAVLLQASYGKSDLENLVISLQDKFPLQAKYLKYLCWKKSQAVGVPVNCRGVGLDGLQGSFK